MRGLWAEPALLPPAGTGRRDRWLVALLLPASVAEGLVRADVVWPVWHIALACVVVLTLLWRGRHPLAMLIVGFGTQTVAGVVPALAGAPYSVLTTTACVLLLPYSLARWGSGRAVVLGLVLLLAAHLGREPLYGESGASIGLGVGFLLLPAALGAAVRFWVRARWREGEQIRMLERERLARDLHDTVAHHVSGIIIQARAGRMIAPGDPARAAEMFGAVEEAASRSLAEMRALVSVLRTEQDGAEREPAPGIADLEGLATGVGTPVDVSISSGLADIGGPPSGVVFRVAQEAVTNARRHALEPSRIRVDVRRDGEAVLVRVDDDGRTPRRGLRGQGYGLVGMRERVGLLGGTFEAGPSPGGGWTVHAVIPLRVEGVPVQGQAT